MEWIIIGLLVGIIIIQLFLLRKASEANSKQTDENIQRAFERIERNFREDFKLNREESRAVAKDNRDELTASMNNFQAAFERGIANFNALQREKFSALSELLASPCTTMADDWVPTFPPVPPIRGM